MIKIFSNQLFNIAKTMYYQLPFHLLFFRATTITITKIQIENF
jgi:hypothetical protein